MAHHINDNRMTKVRIVFFLYNCQSITPNYFMNLFEFLPDWCGIKIHKLNTLQTDAPT